MKASPGDRLVIRHHHVGEHDRDAEVIEALGPDGDPPWVVRWADDGRESRFYPGTDAHVVHHERVGATPAATRRRPRHHPVDVEVDGGLWERFFMVAPLVIVGTLEGDGHDLAPKHMAMPIGWEGHYGFVCTPRHATYRNAERTGAFTVSFPYPEQILDVSLSASPRDDAKAKLALTALATVPARVVDGVLVADSMAQLECELDRIVDGFGDGALIVGRVVAAHVDEPALRRNDRDDADLIHEAPLLAYLHPGRHASIDRSFSLPYPVGFSR